MSLVNLRCSFTTFTLVAYLQRMICQLDILMESDVFILSMASIYIYIYIINLFLYIIYKLYLYTYLYIYIYIFI